MEGSAKEFQRQTSSEGKRQQGAESVLIPGGAGTRGQVYR